MNLVERSYLIEKMKPCFPSKGNGMRKRAGLLPAPYATARTHHQRSRRRSDTLSGADVINDPDIPVNALVDEVYEPDTKGPDVID
jgi:hypothetical protein